MVGTIFFREPRLGGGKVKMAERQQARYVANDNLGLRTDWMKRVLIMADLVLLKNNWPVLRKSSALVFIVKNFINCI